MFPCAEIPDVLLKIVVDFLQAIGLVDDRKEPSRPGETIIVVVLKELLVEVVDEAFHRLLGLDVLRVAPTHQRLGRPFDLPLHLLLGGLRDIYVMTVALESQELIRFIGRIGLFLVGVYLQLVLLEEFRHLPLVFL